MGIPETDETVRLIEGGPVKLPARSKPRFREDDARGTLSPRGRGQGEGEAHSPDSALPPHPVGQRRLDLSPSGRGEGRSTPAESFKLLPDATLDRIAARR